MNDESHDCHRIDPPNTDWWTSEILAVLKSPGDFFWLRDGAGGITDIVIRIPGDEGGTIAPIPVNHGQATQNRWGWDGNEEKPTLQPSIWRNQGLPSHRNEWHGHLQAGRLVSC